MASIKADYVNFDPFEILGISPGASNAEIKKAYRRLSLIYHPDKDTGDEKKFMRITKAHAALTDEVAKKNWEEYGNPDGPGAMSFGIALPSWIVEKENSMFVLMVYVLLLMIVLPICVRIWWSNSLKYGAFKVLVDTTYLYYYFLHRTPLMNIRRVLMVIAASYEFNKQHNSEIVERPSDNEEVPMLMKEIDNLGQNNKEKPLCYEYSLKSRTLLYAHLLRLPLPPNTLEIDKKYIVQKFPYLIQEFVQSISNLTYLFATGNTNTCPSLETLEKAMKLNALVVQSLWATKNPLLQLPHITEDMLRHFISRKRNIRNMQQLAQMEDSERRQLLRNLTDEQYQNLIQVLGQMPLLDVEVRSQVLDDEDHTITTGALVTVTVKLIRNSMSKLFKASEENGDAGSPLAQSMAEVAEEAMNDSDNTHNVQKQNKLKPWEKAKSNRNKKSKNAKAKKKANVQLKNRKQTKPNQQSKPEPISGDVDSQVDTGADSNLESHQSGSESDGDDDSGAEDKGLNKNHDDNESSDGGGDEDKDDWNVMRDNVPKKEIFFSVSKQSHSVHCPYFPEDKQEHWWIYITDRKNATLKAPLIFMTNLVEQEEVELKFSAPMKPGSYQYMVNVRCDSYVDMEYFKPIKVSDRFLCILIYF